MAYHDQRARPRVQQVLHGHHHVGVQVVAGLVQDKHVGRIQQDQHQHKAALLAAGKRFHRHVQVRVGEPQLLQQLGRAHFLAVDDVARVVAGEYLANAVFLQRLQFLQLLGKEGELHRFADLHAAGLRAQLALHDVEQGGLARPVGAHKPIAVAGADHPGYVVEHLRLPVGKRGVDNVHAFLSQAGNRRALQLGGVTQRRLFGDKRTGGFHMETRLAGTRTGTAGKERQLAADKVLALLFRNRGLTLALHALQDVGGVPALEGLGHPIVHFPHAQAHLIEEPAVVRNHHQRAVAAGKALLQVLRQPVDGNHIQMVRGLIEQQHIGIGHQHARQVHAAALTAGKRAHRAFPIQVADHAVHDLPDARIACPFVFGDIAHHVPANALGIVQGIGLAKGSEAHAARAQNAAIVGLDGAIEQPQQRRLAIAVAADHANPVAVLDAQGKRFEDRLGGIFQMHVLAAEQKGHRVSSFSFNPALAGQLPSIKPIPHQPAAHRTSKAFRPHVAAMRSLL